MKKFEEVKRPAIGIEQSSIKPSLGKVIEFYTDKVKEYHNAFNEMNKYIDGLEAQLDYYKKDKRFEVMGEEILSLKSQFEKRQPEIPEFVANYIEAAKEDFWTLLSAMDDPNLSSRVGDWLKGGNFNNQEIFAQAWIYGYTVAKEKQFYLKNKLTGRALYYQNINGEKIFNETGFESRDKYSTFNTRFTQQEIDSMETGSYEQVEVEE